MFTVTVLTAAAASNTATHTEGHPVTQMSRRPLVITAAGQSQPRQPAVGGTWQLLQDSLSVKGYLFHTAVKLN